MSTYGVEPMLFGSDIPVVDPLPAIDVMRSFGEAVTDAVLTTNPDRLLRDDQDRRADRRAGQCRAHARTRRSSDARPRDRRHAGALAAFRSARPEPAQLHSALPRPDLDVWLICWDNAQDTGYHDHDQSSGAVYVCAGMLCEDSFHRDDDGWMRERRASTMPVTASTSLRRTSTESGTRRAACRLDQSTAPHCGAWGTTTTTSRES